MQLVAILYDPNFLAYIMEGYRQENCAKLTIYFSVVA